MICYDPFDVLVRFQTESTKSVSGNFILVLKSWSIKAIAALRNGFIKSRPVHFKCISKGTVRTRDCPTKK